MDHFKILKLALASAVLLSAVELSFAQNPEPYDHSKLNEEVRRITELSENTVVRLSNHHCHPAEIVSVTDRKPIVLFSDVIVENRSNKSISGVKLGWKVYDLNASELKCGIPAEDQVVLSGTTPLIKLVTLRPKETIEIRPYDAPIPIGPPPRATYTIVNEQVALSATHLEPLLSRRREGQKFAVALYVQEIKFTDGTTWTFASQ